MTCNVNQGRWDVIERCQTSRTQICGQRGRPQAIQPFSPWQAAGSGSSAFPDATRARLQLLASMEEVNVVVCLAGLPDGARIRGGTSGSAMLCKEWRCIREAVQRAA